MFWVDETIENILTKQPKDEYLVSDWTTPSGHAHFGSLRGIVVHELIRLGLIGKSKKAEFTFGFDDFDPMDGLPSYIDSSFEKYMGLPLYNVPAPDGEHKSFAEQYMDELRSVINYVGIFPKFVRISDYYKEGKYNDAIRTVLDHAEEIRKIYKEVAGSDKGSEWYPLQVVCPKCGKIGTTKVVGWDGEEVKFRCEENLVEWAKGCGYEGKISPFDGNAKMPWKVDWPCRWSIFGSDIEGEGKDHSAAGGSRDIANHIMKDILHKEPPYDIPYEHLLIGGAKMSSSKGLGVTAKTMADLLPANLLKFLFVRTKPKKAIEFNPEGDTIPLLYDEYDRCAKAYQEESQLDSARAYFYTEQDLTKESPKYLMRFSKIASFLQMPKVDIFEYAEEENGSALTSAEKEEIENRLETAKKWLANYAPESVKFTIQENLPDEAKSLNEAQKEFLTKIADTVSSQEKLSGEDLHQKIHTLKTEMGIAPKEAFSAIYLAFLGKDSGPQAGWLLASLDKDFVIKRLKEV